MLSRCRIPVSHRRERAVFQIGDKANRAFGNSGFAPKSTRPRRATRSSRSRWHAPPWEAQLVTRLATVSPRAAVAADLVRATDLIRARLGWAVASCSSPSFKDGPFEETIAGAAARTFDGVGGRDAGGIIPGKAAAIANRLDFIADPPATPLSVAASRAVTGKSGKAASMTVIPSEPESTKVKYCRFQNKSSALLSTFRGGEVGWCACFSGSLTYFPHRPATPPILFKTALTLACSARWSLLDHSNFLLVCGYSRCAVGSG